MDIIPSHWNRILKSKKTLILAIALLSLAVSKFNFLQQGGGKPQDYGKETYVLRVIDGDTIELSNGEKVRYIGIDTPEIRKKEGTRWIYSPRPYAEAAKNFNRKLVAGKRVKLEFDVEKRDRHKRLLAYVYAGEKMINLEMLKQGYAMLYTYPPNVKYVEKFIEAQRFARENKKGLWGEMAEDIISSAEAGQNVGLIKMVETQVYNTFLSDKVLILNCRDNFKVVIFRKNLLYFPKEALRSPEIYFKHKNIRVCGVIKVYRGAHEIVLRDPSQLEIL